MFTGLVQAQGRVRQRETRGGDVRLHISAGELEMTTVGLGDSIAVNGVCLTAVTLDDAGFAADVSLESLQRTTLKNLAAGSPVNLEKSLTLSTPLGGHLVSGHVDAIGEVVERRQDGRSWRFAFRVPDRLARYIAEKGSVCIDGVSLTVNGVDGAVFDVNIVPHTMQATIIDGYRVGSEVNIEVDLVARYLERLVQGDAAARPGGGVSRELLGRHGFDT
ncbi:riboflavin synthase [Methylonatrum kenyense]|uniref:riboflavin synthase n=1 Tax=Methylonatrum kenyense TaxID=455253 RepID=UPI0020BEE652|nr:riboflavin synthase [Methylonatrum kenyense]MCK8517305.1 riboflavin synthase [Methylonatrum kenyense]